MKKIVLLCLSIATIATVNAQKTVTWGIKAGADISNMSVSVKQLSPSINLGNKTGFHVGIVNNIAFGKHTGLQTELQYIYGGTRVKAGDDIMNAIEGFINDGEDDPEYLVKFPGAVKANVNIHQLYLPIMFKFQPAAGLSVMAGPYLACRIGKTLSFNDNLDTVIGELERESEISGIKDLGKDLIKNNMRTFDFGAALGLEYAFCNGIFIDVRYNISLLNALKDKLDTSALIEKLDPVDKDQNGFGNGQKIKDLLHGAQPTLKTSAIQISVGYRF